MANQIPFSGTVNAGGGYLLPPEQGEILVNGILVETGAIQLAGDTKATTARKTNFPIWLGKPTAAFVGEGASKPVTGAGFGAATINVKKVAATVIFTDEMLNDLQNGDLSVLVDAGVRQALSSVIDANAVGLSGGALISGGTSFSIESSLSEASAAPVLLSHTGGNTNGIVIKNTTKTTGIQDGVSEAIGVLEENGYGNPDNIGILLGFGFQKELRNVRDGFERPVYDGGSFGGQTIDAFYGLTRAHSTNLAALTHSTATLTVKKASAKATELEVKTRGTAPLYVGQPINVAGSSPTYLITGLTGAEGAETKIKISAELEAEAVEGAVVTLKQPVAVVVHRPNLHVRIREDVVLKTSNEASIKILADSGGSEVEEKTVSLFQENLHAVIYETRIGFMIHDPARAVVPLWF